MDDFYFSVNLDNERTLYLAPLTERRISMSGQELADTSGLFLFEQCGTGESARIEIIARIISEESVFRLCNVFKMK